MFVLTSGLIVTPQFDRFVAPRAFLGRLRARTLFTLLALSREGSHEAPRPPRPFQPVPTGLRTRSRTSQGRVWVIGVHTQPRRSKVPIRSGLEMPALSETAPLLHLFRSRKFDRTGSIFVKVFAVKSFRISAHFARFWDHLSPFRINTYERQLSLDDK